ncbi:MAG: DUF2089 domain-containing protein [Chloroflexi bacterium]|nr:DUF2089 domain-containing protein [Chloroflexota bacterium]
MARDWQDLLKLTQGDAFVVERVRLADGETAVEGSFDPPALAMLSPSDLVFVMAFVRSHGSIKEMERVFGISYPTVKNRLNRISSALPLIENDPAPPSDEDEDVLDLLARGAITAAEAIERLS